MSKDDHGCSLIFGGLIHTIYVVAWSEEAADKFTLSSQNVLAILIHGVFINYAALVLYSYVLVLIYQLFKIRTHRYLQKNITVLSPVCINKSMQYSFYALESLATNSPCLFD